MLKLIIGNRNYSSWSLRAWLFLRESGIEFEEIRVPLFTPGWREEIGRYSPAGRVPVLVDGDLSIWDSMAIAEHVRERHPEALGWPEAQPERALARSISAEMHSGFLAIRDELPQNLRASKPRRLDDLSEACRSQIARIDDIWADCRRTHRSRGSWLFGEFSLADVVFAPVALRFSTYSIDVSEDAREFIEAVEALPSVREWVDASHRETERLPFIDDLTPTSESPLTPG